VSRSPRFVEVAADRIDVDVRRAWWGRGVEAPVVPRGGEELDLLGAWRPEAVRFSV
jgi:hypothetical protein